MKNIKKLKLHLQRIKDELKSMPTLESMSLAHFLKYKHLINKKTALKKQLKKSMLSAKDVITKYKEYNNRILNNMKISCRQYCRLQKKAEYKRDIKLYQYGMLGKRPIHPVMKPISILMTSIKKPISKSFNSFKEIIKHLKSKILPQKINRLVIHGYKTFNLNCRYMKKHLSSNEYTEYLRNIIKDAQDQLNVQSINHPSSNLSFSPPIQILRNTCPNVPLSTVHDLEQRKQNITFSR